MHILGIVGSMRRNRYTTDLVSQVIEDIKTLNPGATGEIIFPLDEKITPCRVVCSEYCSRTPYKCINPDFSADLLESMIKADAIVIGAPQYFRAPPAKFHMLIEKLVAIFFNYENGGSTEIESPVKGKPCGLIGIAEYSNPHQMLEYLHDFCILLNMNPVKIDRFPYLGVSGQGDIAKDQIFKPIERSRELAEAIVREIALGKA
ncbi:MAG: hypothetical protein CVV64_20435 [Candidatus Wallbacteria bacterium HGW-Wallbacteria-1]|uniref:NADPH-dependent FMN reductase-like domain-containing protein n=1 Tax=Candidatus Wallbacteria bacterium HGW-Wallbacteria-1 TaxID=2013854 RepID=A0A2N1PIE1_9BACT|nr:MAG: hypothetical protein CVV64_20435 [Candidatus Wallbacteria bacterium HGW-Wallbacteria-1]